MSYCEPFYQYSYDQLDDNIIEHLDDNIFEHITEHLFDHLNIHMNTSLAVKGALAHRLQRQTARTIQNGRQGAPKMADWVWNGVNL